MDVYVDRKMNVLIASPWGRLDEHGALRLEDVIGHAIHDDDRSIVVDMDQVTYLSSAGIRAFLSLKEHARRRKGILALAEVRPFPRHVLHMSGYLPAFNIFNSVPEALAACHAGEDRAALHPERSFPSVTRDRVRYVFEESSEGRAWLQVTGSLHKVLAADITDRDIGTLRFSDADYSLGLGALGEGIADAKPLFGEMITLHGSMVWVPTDGNMTPDFFTPAEDTGEVEIYTGFNAALHGPFHDVILVECERPGGISLAELYQALFRLARERGRPDTGVITVAMWAVAAGVRSSEIRKSPIRENRPANGKSIMDPENFDEWNAPGPGVQYEGDTIVSFGFGIDLQGLAPDKEGMVASLYYVHPENRGSKKQFLHNHGVVFRDIPWDPELNLNGQIARIVKEGEFVDMRHLLDDTRIVHAKCGVSYISDVVSPGEGAPGPRQ